MKEKKSSMPILIMTNPTFLGHPVGSDARLEDCLISDGPPPVDDSLPKIGGLSASDCLPPKNSKIGLIMRSNVKRSLV